mmetsp:Transcript_6155/g.16743  ORF Transcript_6155/g.16743 Transcript_6155/m.16743 type:complete len:309 (-) Transcript_6155:318-1244(-)
MKFALLTASLLSVASAMTIKGKNAAKIMSSARRLDQNNQQDEPDYGDYGYLVNYSLKLVGCKAGETVVNPQDGEYEYNAAIVRICPADSCDEGCSEGYGDMVVGLNTYVQAFFEDQRDNMNWDDAVNPDEYTECREYEVEQEDDGNNNNNNGNQAVYYVGPTCGDDGISIVTDLFTNEICTVKSETTFAEISNGWSLPFSEESMVTDQCQTCLMYNDNYELEMREMCEETYMAAGYKCEENMEYVSQYGPNVGGCEQITALLPQASTGGSSGAIFGWIIFAFIIVGTVGYVMWWRNKKAATTSDGIMS